MLKLTKVVVLSFFLGFFILKPIPVMAENWPMEMYNSAKTGHNPEENKLRPPLKLKWRFQEAKLGKGPVVDETSVYTAGVDGKIFSLNKITGALVWENAITFEKDGKIYESTANSSPIIDGDNLYVSGTIGKIMALEKTTGKIIWQNDIKNDRPLAIWKDSLLMSTYEGNIAALDKRTGITIWSYPLNGQPGEMTVSEKGIYVDEYNNGNYIHTLYSINPDTGQLNWKLETGRNSSRIAYDKDLGRLFSLTTSGELSALSPADGTILWKTRVYKGEVSFATFPAIDEKHVYVSTGDFGGIVAVSKQYGKIIWANDSFSNDQIHTDPSIVNRVVYLGTASGLFTGLDSETGQVLWKYQSEPQDISTNAAVSDGVLYIGSRASGIYAFESLNPGVYVSESGPSKISVKALKPKLNFRSLVSIIIYVSWMAGAIFYVNRIRSKRFQTDELHRFASQMASAGKSKQEIMAVLRQAGWPEVKIESVLTPQIPWWGRIIILSSSLGVFFFSDLFLTVGAVGFLSFTQEHSSWPIFYNLGNWYGNILLSRAIMPLVSPVSLMITLVYLWWLGITKKVLVGRIAIMVKILLLVSLGLTTLVTLFETIFILMIAMGKIN